jgi:carbamoyl-phosphate synthase large subunit
VAVKVPVFSSEKLSDANSALSPEMKSTGEVLGVGRTLNEALYKGLVSAGFKLKGRTPQEHQGGILISVNRRDQPEIVNISRKLDKMGYKLYATDGTAREIMRLGTDVEIVGKLGKDSRVFELLEQGEIDYIILTGSAKPEYIRDFIRLNRRALQLSIPCLTSLDTANALADILACRYTQQNTELVDIAHMREEKQTISFFKMQDLGNDYIYIDNFDGQITCPESLCVSLCDRHYGVGGDGIVLIEWSQVADGKMRVFNMDGSEGKMAGNALRCAAKLLYDRGLCKKETMAIETASGVKNVRVFTRNRKVGSATVDMGRADLRPEHVPVTLPGDKVVARKTLIGDTEYEITCVSVGNPHCVVFVDRVDALDLEKIGPQFEYAPIFPQRVNTEFIRVVNETTIKMRVWERGNGETLGCGTGACAAVVAAVENGLCQKGVDITVRLAGGDLVVNYTDEGISLTGGATLVYQGTTVY